LFLEAGAWWQVMNGVRQPDIACKPLDRRGALSGIETAGSCRAKPRIDETNRRRRPNPSAAARED
jgi:hypothetical protein